MDLLAFICHLAVTGTVGMAEIAIKVVKRSK